MNHKNNGMAWYILLIVLSVIFMLVGTAQIISEAILPNNTAIEGIILGVSAIMVFAIVNFIVSVKAIKMTKHLESNGMEHNLFFFDHDLFTESNYKIGVIGAIICAIIGLASLIIMMFYPENSLGMYKCVAGALMGLISFIMCLLITIKYRIRLGSWELLKKTAKNYPDSYNRFVKLVTDDIKHDIENA